MDHDGGYHLLFSHPEMVEDLLKTFVPETWVRQLDFSTLARVNAKLHAEGLERREGDVIYRINLTSGDEIYILLVIGVSIQTSTLDASEIVGVCGVIISAPDSGKKTHIQSVTSSGLSLSLIQWRSTLELFHSII